MAKHHDILFIADEIATGFWRTGHRFACEAADVPPDIMCLGKALTGGTMTMGATLATEEVFEAFLSDQWASALMHGPTFMANPLACAAANASLDLFEREPKEGRVEEIEGHLREGLEPCRSMAGVVDVRVRGAIGVVQLEAGDGCLCAPPAVRGARCLAPPLQGHRLPDAPTGDRGRRPGYIDEGREERPERAVMPDFALYSTETSMRNAARSLRFVLLVPLVLCATARGDEPVMARIETTLETSGSHIRQLAYDGSPSTFFSSKHKSTDKDHFTLVLDRPVKLKSIEVITGRPDGSERVTNGVLEVSTDGRDFQELSRFHDGVARGGSFRSPIAAIRIKPGPSPGPIAVRELALVSDPPVSIYRFPVEFVVDVADEPELKDWAEMTARTCERAYPMINEELASEGFKPPQIIHLKLSKEYRGVAGTANDHIVGSVDYFRRHTKDVGAMVHETTHVVQAYRRGAGQAGWSKGSAITSAFSSSSRASWVGSMPARPTTTAVTGSPPRSSPT